MALKWVSRLAGFRHLLCCRSTRHPEEQRQGALVDEYDDFLYVPEFAHARHYKERDSGSAHCHQGPKVNARAKRGKGLGRWVGIVKQVEENGVCVFYTEVRSSCGSRRRF